MTHTTTILTKPPPGAAPIGGTDGATSVEVTVRLSDDPLKAARQTLKIEKLMDRIIKIGNSAE